MLPLREIQEQYKHAKYLETDDGKKNTSIVIAQARKNQKNWYEEEYMDLGFEVVPSHLISLVQDYTQPHIDRSLMGDERLKREARKKILACRVVGVIETAPTVAKDNPKFVALEDMLVVEPIEPTLEGLKIYVPHRHAGMSQTHKLRHMIDRILPVKLVDLKERRYENYFLENSIKHNYVAEGDIDIAEFIMNSYIADNIPSGNTQRKLTPLQNRILNQPFKGLVTYVSDKGVFVLTNELYTFFIPNEEYSYMANSKVYSIKDTVHTFDEVEFNYTGFRRGRGKNTNSENENTNNTILLQGEHISFEEKPVIRLKRLIEEKKMVGKVFKAYLITYDPTKKHFIELEDFPGVLVKLKPQAEITPQLAVTKEPISVFVERARAYTDTESGKISIFVHCLFNTTINERKNDMLASFFQKK
ncbi:hypothetical protein GPZ88_09920 (plasmid) [Streptococcus ruminicola]|uniref:Uncharacterized protein n=1 Tax=Streptococcus ruminicola TaxID=2686210 RepID=A0A6G8I2R0_9STRE|nr:MULTISPECIES: hypothetical protein [Streptococcus]QGX47336.1 hypothetical protein GPA00_09375 [Streptococcus equinus]QIM47385.1 hypothetical protein GPZ88_09920 [Streptococcus ruminicola]